MRYDPKIATRWLVIAFSSLSVLLFFYQSIRNHNYLNGNDLTSYINSAAWFFNGENPYTAPVRRFIYPQFLLLIAYPLTFLQSGYFQKGISASAWSLVSYFAFFKTIALSLQFADASAIESGRNKSRWFEYSLLVLLLHPFLQDEFLNGQANLLMVGAAAGFFFMLQKNRLWIAALFLSIAISLKIGPIVLLAYPVVTRQYWVVPYTALLTILLVLILPYGVNSQSLEYYRYFISEVMPSISGSDFRAGFRSFSLLSTISFLFGIEWIPLLKMGAVGLIAAVLSVPILCFGLIGKGCTDRLFHLALFAAFLSVIPLTFPMSETHHLLILTIPFIVIILYFKRILGEHLSLFSDQLSLLFLGSMIAEHLGQVFKATPLRLIGLIGIYAGLFLLVRHMARYTNRNSQNTRLGFHN